MRMPRSLQCKEFPDVCLHWQHKEFVNARLLGHWHKECSHARLVLWHKEFSHARFVRKSLFNR